MYRAGVLYQYYDLAYAIVVEDTHFESVIPFCRTDAISIQCEFYH